MVWLTLEKLILSTDDYQPPLALIHSCKVHSLLSSLVLVKWIISFIVVLLAEDAKVSADLANRGIVTETIQSVEKDPRCPVKILPARFLSAVYNGLGKPVYQQKVLWLLIRCSQVGVIRWGCLVVQSVLVEPWVPPLSTVLTLGNCSPSHQQ